MSRTTLHVISHTHWDREWYLPYQQFRMRLVDLIDHLIEAFNREPLFHHFHLDAQTIVLKDYLDIRPSRLSCLTTLVREGRLLIGPWYQLHDEFLVSGEATIRSLLIGHRIAEEFGAVMKVGYLPDQFGHISQMPQILRGFGIDNALLGRGYQIRDDQRHAEFLWRAPDESVVVAVVMPQWYNNAQHFPEDAPDAAATYVQGIVEGLAPLCLSSHLLLMNGVDHLEAQGHVGRVIDALRGRLPDADILHSTLPAFIEGVKADIEQAIPAVVSGELRDDDGGAILAGTLSTRSYLKTANYDAETVVERYVEPLGTIARAVSSPSPYDRDYPVYLWKLLMENHPHDSICGCSVDQVHREMMIRFDQVRQIGVEMIDRAAQALLARVVMDDDGNDRKLPILVFNPLNWPRSGVVRAEVDFPLGPPSRTRRSVIDDLATTPDIAAIQMLDPDGRSTSFSVVRAELTSRQVLSPVELPMVHNVRRFVLSFFVEDVPPLGYKVYTACPAVEHIPQRDSMVTATDRSLENGLVRVTCRQDGTITLLDIETGEVYEPLLLLEDGGDVGDEYRYQKPVNDTLICAGLHGVEITLDYAGPEAAILKISGILHLPERTSDDRLSRSKGLVTCRVLHRITLTSGSKRVDVETEVMNQAQDHRFRLLFPTMITTDHSYAGAPFDVVRRPILLPQEWRDASTFRPMQGFVDLAEERDGRGLALFTKGLSEYEVYDDRERTLALTLLRCVGYLSGGGDTPTALPTPDAQCIGTYHFAYALFPHRGDWHKAGVHREAMEYSAPLRTFVGNRVDETAKPGGELGGSAQRADGRVVPYWGPGREGNGDMANHCGGHEQQTLPSSFSLLRIAPDDLIVTALKIAEDDDAVVVRFFNVSTDPTVGIIGFFREPQSVYYVSLNEENQIELYLGANGTLTMPVPGKKIVTLKVYF